MLLPLQLLLACKSSVLLFAIFCGCYWKESLSFLVHFYLSLLVLIVKSL